MADLKNKLAFIIVLAVIVVGGSSYNYWQKKSVAEVAAAGSVQNMASANASDVVIYVSGAVNKPGVITVQASARVLDAVNAAGGILPSADTSQINLAQVVKDGMQIHVPSKVNAVSSGQTGSTLHTGPAQTDKININTADKKELDKLPGVGPALAENIIQYRQTNGPFKDMNDFKKVPGIGDSKYNKIKDQISL